MKLIKLCVIACLAVLVTSTAAALTVDSAAAPITLGRWHSNRQKAIDYSNANNIPMVFVWGSVQCSYCDKLDTYLETQVFKSWQAERKLVMVYIKNPTTTITADATYARNGQNGQLTDLPLVSLLWTSKNPLPYNFTGRSNGSTVDINAQAIISMIEQYVGTYNSAGLTIDGQDKVFDNATTQYRAYYKDSAGTQVEVTSQVTWSVTNPTYGSINAQGIFTPADTTQSREVVISASYQSGAYAGTRTVLVYDKLYPPASGLSSISIDGPSAVHGGTQAQYRCLLDYGIGLLFEAGGSVLVTWSESSSVISIAASGLLSSIAVTADTSIPLIATVKVGTVTKTKVQYVNITANPPAPVYTLLVNGLNSVTEGGSAQYTATLKATGQADQDVTATALWSLIGAPAGSFIAQGTGTLSAGLVDVDTACTVQAQHSGVTGTTPITVVNNPVVLIYLEVSGAAQVTEGATAAYTCIARYSDETFMDVTAQATWSVSSPTAATVNAGTLTAAQVTQNTPLNVIAGYGGKSGELNITILNVVKILDHIVVSGPANVNEVTTANYTCMAFYADGSSADITQSAVWSINHTASSITAGVLAAGSVETNTACVITATSGGKAGNLSIHIMNTPAQGIPYSESFESGNGLWAGGTNGFQWVSHTGATPSPGTGPSVAADGLRYLYTEASGNTNKIASLEAQFSLSGAAVPFLFFDYHMYGVDCGMLQVDIFDGAWNTAVWTKSGMQQDDPSSAWSTAKVDLSAYAAAGLITVRFKATTGVSYLSDLALDKIRLLDLALEDPGSYDEWVLVEQVPAESQGGADTPFGDGIPNLLKYASGLDGARHSTADYMKIDGATNVFGIIYYQDRNAAGVQIIPMWAYTLGGFWSSEGIQRQKIGEEGTRDLWRAVIPQDGGVAPKGFMRLRAVEMD